MCVKFLLKNLNSNPCPLHLTSTYTYEVTITLRVHGGTLYLNTMNILIIVAKIKS